MCAKQSSGLYGLVLGGGKSSRMGRDKNLLQYHGQTQREHLNQLLQPFCEQVLLSLRPGQEQELTVPLPYVLDSQDVNGPLNGILSALHQCPEKAFLVIACDLPLVTSSTISRLIQHRNPSKVATTYATRASGLPEPMLTIWEPKAFAQGLAFCRETGKTCPRKFLLNTEVELVFPAQDDELYNANSPEDYAYVTSKLTHGQPL